MTITKLSNLVSEIRFPFERNKVQEFLLISDVHFDNAYCDREKFFEMMDEAKSRGAKVIINGDFFCLMQGKFDKRSSKGALRPEYMKDSYVDAVISDAVEKLGPYKDNLIFISAGNHETTFLSRADTDVLERFITLYNYKWNANVIKGGYQGWLMIKLSKSDIDKEAADTFKIKFKHGYGGGGPVTNGVIQHSREQMWTENADIIWMGHTHDCYVMPTITEGANSNSYNSDASNMIYQRVVWNVRTPSFKPEYKEGGWAVERGHKPKPIGGVWLQLNMKRNESGTRRKFMEAKLVTDIKAYI